jgi:hypothetical protein
MRMSSPIFRVGLGIAALAVVAVAVPAAADLVPDGKTYAPVELTLDNQAAFTDATIVVLGCNSEGGGRHQVAFAKPSEPLRCGVKLPPTVYAVPNKDVKPLRDLVAKDSGWAAEGIEGRKLLEKQPTCGTIDEKTLVDKSQAVTFFTARYALEKTASGCSIKKVGETVAQTAVSASGSAAASASASASGAPPPASGSAAADPAPSASAAPAAGAAKSGCGSCAAVGSPDTSGTAGTAGLLAALALAALEVARRKRCSSLINVEKRL